MSFIYLIFVVAAAYIVVRFFSSSNPGEKRNYAKLASPRFVRFNPFSGDEYVICKQVNDFIAIDFETANELPISVCAVGIAIVENSNVVMSQHWYIRPKEMRFTNTHIHKISPDMVKNSPTFDEFWNSTLRNLITDKTVAAYNASFDIGCLENLLHDYRLDQPRYAIIDALQTARTTWSFLSNHKLSTVAQHLRLRLDHHNPESDAVACASIILTAQQQHGHEPILKCLRTKYPNQESLQALAAISAPNVTEKDYEYHFAVIESFLQHPHIDNKEKAILHRKCGEASLRCNNIEQTLFHFEKALEYNPKIGVAMALKKLKKTHPQCNQS